MTKELIQRINGKYPIIMVDMVEDSEVYRDLVLELLRKSGLHNVRHFDNPVDYDKALAENPSLIPHLAMVDYKFDGYALNGLDITDNLMKRSKRKSLRTRVIMITDYNYPDDIIRFFHMGGMAWVYKDQRDELVSKINEAIADIQDALEERAWIEGLEEAH